MIKSELVQIIASRNPHLYQRDVETIVNAIFDEITDALCDSNRVELRGFGAFSVKNRPPRAGRNPRTGESVEVEEKWVPFFKAGKELRERLNDAGSGIRRWWPCRRYRAAAAFERPRELFFGQAWGRKIRSLRSEDDTSCVRRPSGVIDPGAGAAISKM